MDDGDMRVRLRTLGETLRAIRVERGFSLGEVTVVRAADRRAVPGSPDGVMFHPVVGARTT